MIYLRVLVTFKNDDFTQYLPEGYRCCYLKVSLCVEMLIIYLEASWDLP